jgi:PAS domain S-box-containing protein
MSGTDASARQELPRERAWHALSSGPVVVFRWVNAPGWPVEFVSPNVFGMFGVTAQDLLSGAVRYSDLVHPDDLARVTQEVDAAVAQDRIAFGQSYRFRRADGEYRHLYDHTVVVRDAAGVVTHFEGYVYDDTRRLQTELALREEEEDSRKLVRIAEVLAGDLTYQDLCSHALSALQDYVPMVRASLYLQRTAAPHFVDRVASVKRTSFLEEHGRVDLRLNGWYRAALYASLPIIAVDVATDPRFADADFARVGLRSIIVIPMRLRIGRDGYLVLGNRAEDDPIPDSTRLRRFLKRLGVLLATAMDRVRTLMERQAIEEQLQQAQKMEAVGMLSGGVAHNFNNTLTVILGYTSMLLEGGSFSEADHAKLLAVYNAGESSAAAVRQLLDFSRKQKEQNARPIDVGQVVDGLEMMLGPLLGERLQLSVEKSEDLGFTYLEPGELEMILMNLAVNAKDATRGKGRLRFRAGRQPCHDEDRGECIVLEIIDDGEGMSEEIQQRLFEPFFTTKEEGHGTGLGLAAVYGVVQRAGGDIHVESEVGVGTAFKLLLPRMEEVETRSHGNSGRTRPTGGSGVILLAEDQESVRHLTVESLRSSGFTILSAADGEQALELLEQATDGVDLLLTDVVMPGMDGLELCRRFAAACPDVPILLMSGFVDRAFPGASKEAQGIPLLQKPFTSLQLIEAVTAAMAQA